MKINTDLLPSQNMPELPEVETVRQGLEIHLLDTKISKVILNRDDLRFPFPPNFISELTGRTVKSVRRRAKYLLISLDDDVTWLCHLGMTGRWTLIGDGIESTPGKFSNGAPVGTGDGPHDWVIIHLENGKKAVFSDHRRFGYMDCFKSTEEKQHRLLKNLGPEPTPSELTPEILAGRLRGKKATIKSALLNQNNVAGLGNIYVCEILFRSGISPKKIAKNIAGKTGIPKKIVLMTSAIHDVIIEAIDAGGSTLQDFRGIGGDESMGYFSHNFAVYDRQGEECINSECNSRIKRITQSNRSSFYCPKCQR